MQRGAAKRDRSYDQSRDYEKMKPVLRPDDLAYLGQTEDRFSSFAAKMIAKVKAYAAGGFKKPAQVSKLLNRELIRTPSGDDWNPRLAHFLLAKVHALASEARQKKRNAPPPQPPAPTKAPRPVVVRAYSPGGAPLSSDEMKRRREALAAYLATTQEQATDVNPSVGTGLGR